MFESLDKLRQKPDSHKKKIAFFSALSFVLVIFIVWATVIFPDIKSKNSQTANVATSTSPTDGIISFLSTSFEQIGNQFNDIKTAVSSLSTTTEYYNSVANPIFNKK